MDRCIVLVDAGYLLGAAATLLTGDATRSRLSVDYRQLIHQIRQRAEADTGQPLLRIYWFDGAPDRVPQPEHRRLRVMPRVTVRLGLLTRIEGRFQQKGVDAAFSELPGRTSRLANPEALAKGRITMDVEPGPVLLCDQRRVIGGRFEAVNAGAEAKGSGLAQENDRRVQRR